MSDIKHQFTGGKMNKDLDERLIPNGEYRDAMNIQVSTSEDSKVGTVQNILGNELGCIEDVTPAGSVTIGSIADEKNDALYWLVSGPSFEGVSLQSLINDPDFILETAATATADSNPYYAKDMIMRKTTGDCEPVLVDQWAGIFPNQQFGGAYWSTGFDNSLVLSNSSFLEHVHLGMSVFGIDNQGNTTDTRTVTNIGSLYSIRTPYFIEPGLGASVAVPFTGSFLPQARFVITRHHHYNTNNIWYQNMSVVYIANSSSLQGGLQVGDFVSTVDGGAMAGHEIGEVLGNGLFKLVTNLNNFTSSTLTGNNFQGSVVGNDGIFYYPFHEVPPTYVGSPPNAAGLMGTNGDINVYRQTYPQSNDITFDVNSQWLNEIAGVFYDLTADPIVAFPSPTPIKIKNNVNWPDSVNACLALDALTVVPIIPIGSLPTYDTTYDVVDCTTGADILPVGRIGGRYMDLVVENDAFNNQTITLDAPINMQLLNTDGTPNYLYFSGERMLNFSPTKKITGINIIDDMLFWVDGEEDETGIEKIKGTEPKKINIKRSLAGTNPDGNYHTKLINDDTSTYLTGASEGPIKEEHITVIKKAPKTPLHFDLVKERDVDVNYSGVMEICSSDGSNNSSFTDSSQNRRDFNGLKAGDTFRTEIPTDINGDNEFSLPWSVGTSVVIKEFDEDGSPPSVPFAGNEYRIKGVIVAWNNQRFEGSIDNTVTPAEIIPAQVAIRISSIVGFPPQAASFSTLSYAVDIFSEGEKLFEYKFPRFSYRYKYKDGQVSTYAPFTSVAFSPGGFNYHPTKGYNLGMTNTIREILVKGFVTQDMPKDVVAIDLLYKEDSSPNIYTVDTVKKNDQIEPGQLFNHWDSNEYKITSDTIHSVVPSNQLLRVWDNVPRKVLAQEVTGNRVVYGNYLQNYDLTVNESDFYPKFIPYLSESTDSSSSRSIKSLRDYQLGVVFTDKYGRETPVIANSTGAFKVPKSDAKFKNSLSIGFDGNGPPAGLEYFKFFIKETSGEYYNLAMDRFFSAEDGNYWISFPSTERNKVDEDSFLILKKGHDSKELVSDKARYKILAIANEAPDFIKTSHYNIGEVQQNDETLFGSLVNIPEENKDYFQILSAPFQSTTLSNMDEIEDDLYVEFGVAGTNKVSNRYRIAEITNPAAGNSFYVKIDDVFGNDVDMIAGNSGVINRAIVRFYKYKVENKSIFDGRFFVKILNDEVFKKNVDQENIDDKEYIVTAEKKVYFMSDDHDARHATSYQALSTSTATFGLLSGIGSFWESPGAQLLSAFPSAQNSISRSEHWFRYETYFKNRYYNLLDSSGFPFGHNGSFHTYNRGENLEGGVSGKEVFEDVMFIDRGAYAGNQNNSPNGILSTGSLNQYYEGYKGLGVKNSSTYGRMDLSFGSLEPESVSGKAMYGGSYYKYTNSWEDKIGIEGGNFWDLTSSDRAKYNQLAPIYDKIQSGQQFRWKEDPSQTIYTITQQVTNYNINRFDNTTRGSHTQSGLRVEDYYKVRRSDGRLVYDAAPGNLFSGAIQAGQPLVGDYDSGSGSKYALSSNFQQKKRFTFTPNMLNWDPTKNDTLGTITGGALVDKHVTPGVSGINWLNPTGFTNTLQGARSVGGASNSLQMFKEHYENTFDSLNEVRWGLEGMLLTKVGNDVLVPPVLVDSIDTSSANTVTILFKGYQGTSGDFSINIAPAAALENLTFEQPAMNGLSVNSANNINEANSTTHGIGAIGYTIEFIEVKEPEKTLAVNPAIWETEPKESTDLDIYYEISGSNPISLSSETIKTVLPTGSSVYSAEGFDAYGLSGIMDNNYYDGITIRLNQALCVQVGGCVVGGKIIKEIVAGSVFRVERPNGTSIEVEVDSWDNLEVDKGGFDVSKVFKLKTELYNSNYTLDWHNCYSFGNGVESNRVRDTFNLPFITNGVKASTTLEGGYKEEHRRYGLIYSGIYNSNSGVNNLNQFITAEKITKDINPIYGSIQKLHSRSTADGDLIVLCEDRVLKILADKNALFNADGNPQLVATDRVLGQAEPFSGEFGISKNPESFASESYRVYFADKVRGAIVRLSKDGLTAISSHGMKDWFRDNLKLSTKITGSFDDRNNEYNVTLNNVTDQVKYPNGQTVSFREDVKGWVSFKSFTPENAISCANEYYTFNKGTLWKQNSDNEDRNTFYKELLGEGFTPSSINVIINKSPSVIKTFHTLNYEGTQSKVETFTHYTDSDGTTVNNNEYYNLQPKKGWKVLSITTDQEQGSVKEFIEKEGKWFNYIRGKAGNVTDGSNTHNFDNADFAFQGLGMPQAVESFNTIGCTDPDAFNYDSIVVIDDGSCVDVVNGCIDPTATGYNLLANTDDGSCIYPGCTDSSANNYDVVFNSDDGNCTYDVYGCMDFTEDANSVNVMNNFNLSATNACNGINGNYPNFSVPITGGICDGINPVDNCCCVPFVYGCMDPTADNFDAAANVSQVDSISSISVLTGTTNPCFYTILGCTDSTSCVYDSTATIDDGTCNWCNNILANNYDGLDPDGNDYQCDSGCLTCKQVTNIADLPFGGNPDTSIDIQWDETWSGNAAVDYYEITYSDGTTTNTISNIQPNIVQGVVYHNITGLTQSTTYSITVQAFCLAGTSPLNPSHSTASNAIGISAATAATPIFGCTDDNACNYDSFATTENGTCNYSTCAGCMDSTAGNNLDVDGNGGYAATNYDPNATIDNGSCNYISGCMDPTATNYDATASVADSCIYPIFGCMDDSLANNLINYAALNYNVNATVEDNSCIYQMPVLSSDLITGPGADSSRQAGLYLSGLWGGGSYRKLRVFWDVSRSPKIDKNNILSAHQLTHQANTSAPPASSDITNFTSPTELKFSNSGTYDRYDLSTATAATPIELIQLEKSALKIPFTNTMGMQNQDFYPPNVPVDDGKQQQSVKFSFDVSASYPVPQFETNLAEFNVYLGCDDDSFLGFDQAGNFDDLGFVGGVDSNGSLMFFDNSTCTNTFDVGDLSALPGSIAGSITTQVLDKAFVDTYAPNTNFPFTTFTKISWQHDNWANQTVNFKMPPERYNLITAFTTGNNVVPTSIYLGPPVIKTLAHTPTVSTIVSNSSSGDSTGEWLYIKVTVELDGTYSSSQNQTAETNEMWIQV